MQGLPAVWGGGQVFAFSGLDGWTSAASPMVGHTLADRIGLRLFFDPPVEIWCQAILGEDAARRYPRYEPVFTCVAGDVIAVEVRDPEGRRGRIAWVPLEQDIIAGEAFGGLMPFWSVGGPTPGSPLPPGRHRHRAPQGVVAVVVREDGERRRFAVCHDTMDESMAYIRAEKALQADLGRIVDERVERLASLAVPAALPAELSAMYRKAVWVLRTSLCSAEGRIRRTWAAPNRWPYRWMWTADAAFAAVAMRKVFPEAARASLQSALESQDEDGRTPLYLRPDGGCPEIGHAPCLAWAAGLLCGPENADFAAEVYPRLRKYLLCSTAARSFNRTGLYRWLHGDEVMDNSPRFDAGAEFGAVDLAGLLCIEFEHAAVLAGQAGEAKDAADWLGRRRRLAREVERRLWDESGGCYGDLRADGSLDARPTCAAFAPLAAGICSRSRATRLVRLLKDPRRFGLALPVPSVAADHPAFCTDMWRGPAWPHVNWWIARGLDRYGRRREAEVLRRTTVEAAARGDERTGCLYEFYDSRDRLAPAGLDRKCRLCYAAGCTNITDHARTAAALVLMCDELYGGLP